MGTTHCCQSAGECERSLSPRILTNVDPARRVLVKAKLACHDGSVVITADLRLNQDFIILIVYDELLSSLAFALVHPASLHAASMHLQMPDSVRR